MKYLTFNLKTLSLIQVTRISQISIGWKDRTILVDKFIRNQIVYVYSKQRLTENSWHWTLNINYIHKLVTILSYKYQLERSCHLNQVPQEPLDGSWRDPLVVSLCICLRLSLRISLIFSLLIKENQIENRIRTNI